MIITVKPQMMIGINKIRVFFRSFFIGKDRYLKLKINNSIPINMNKQNTRMTKSDIFNPIPLNFKDSFKKSV